MPCHVQSAEFAADESQFRLRNPPDSAVILGMFLVQICWLNMVEGILSHWLVSLLVDSVPFAGMNHV